MTDPGLRTARLIAWFKNFVRPVIEKTEAATALEELDKLASQVEELERNKGKLFPICLLGQAGVGKSTLINTLIADNEIVVPSGGGTGPLTANALRVVYGERPSFVVRYHSKKQINETRFILESEIKRRVRNETPETVIPPSAEDTEMPTVELDSDEQKKTRTEEAISRARLLVAGAQTAHRELEYLADALRLVLGHASRFKTEIVESDREGLAQVREALEYGASGTPRNFDSLGNADFGRRLQDHACGYLAPLILEMTIHWPSPLLSESVELVDLPGIGILSDAYESITSDYLRNRAKAVMLVVDSRGLRRDDAELLKSSGFLNRLLHAGSDLAEDPVALMIAVVKIDDVAVENWRNDKAVNGAALKTKAQHFTDQVERCRHDIAQRLESFLRELWEDDTEGKRHVIQSIVDTLQVFPVSAIQFRFHRSTDPEEDKPFLPDEASTNIPALRSAISRVAQGCIAEQHRRHEEAFLRFFGQLRARLEVLSAQQSEQQKAESEITNFKQSLETFMAPLQREFDNRRGAFRNFLRKTIPTQIQARVETASNKARKAIQGDLRVLRDIAHWRTLQAAVRREGTFYGSRHINLPHDFALRFEEPVAEVWAREILVDVRRETREFADYQASAVNQVLEWARGQGIRVSTRLLEALVEAVKQHRQQVNAVGKEAIDELRDQVRSELIKKIEAPIRRRCQKFVEDGQNSGRGIRVRILDLFDEMAEEVIATATEPTTLLLVEKFREVDKEILTAFGDHSEPLSEAADALVKRQAKASQREDAQLTKAINAAVDSIPSVEAIPA